MVPLGGGGVGDPWVEAVDKADDEVTGSVCDVDAFMEEVSGGDEDLALGLGGGTEGEGQ